MLSPWVLTSLLLSLHSWAFDPQWITSEIRKAHLSPESLSLYAEVDDKVVFTHRADQAMIPASTTKILTAAAVLHSLDPAIHFTTELAATAPIQDGVLHGDLYLHGGGDPSFVSESMWVLVNELTRTGLHRIEGQIVVDDSLFDTVRFDSTRDPSRNDRAYDAPIGAMSMNWNSVNVYVRPQAQEGLPAAVFADPETNYIRLVNKTKTVSGTRVEVQVSRKGKVMDDDDTVDAGDELIVEGRIGIHAPEKVIYKNISHPDLWSGYNLQSFLKQRGIVVSGGVRSGSRPASANTMAHVDSKPLALIIADMLKFSNNFVAEMLTKQMALKAGPGPATLNHGLEVLRNYLQSIGLDPVKAIVVNPSGFSRENHISARDLDRAVEAVRGDFLIFPELMAALPISGRDGTLKNRMKTIPQKVRAKTGQLNGVAALAGFFQSSHNKTGTFAFIFNGAIASGPVARAFMDHLCEVLVQ
jgi:D-alanyl-D-alanine carboxypeptidase/D-alanyl-D-alanine-endopeptidase (penicillin-binding protein 4)